MLILPQYLVNGLAYLLHDGQITRDQIDTISFLCFIGKSGRTRAHTHRKKKGAFVSDWREELNEFLAPHGAVFSDQSWDEFRQEMRHNISRIHVPLFTAILLNDGIGSATLRIGTIVDCIVMFFAFYSEKYSGAEILFMLIVSAVICIPGFWMWRYRLMAPKERMARMFALFRKKVAEQEQYPPRD